MKKLLISLIAVGCIGCLSGCSSTGGCWGCGSSCCGGYTFDWRSQCGGYSCTDNYQIIQSSNPCPGPYQCPTDNMSWV